MAPEPEVLKRKRSRPSDWWAAAPTTPQQHDEPPARKRGGPSNLNANGKGMKDAPAAGNRGKITKGKEVMRDGKNEDEDELQEKQVRRGRSSGGVEELLREAESSRATKEVDGKKGKGAQDVPEDQSAPKKQGRPAAAQGEEQAEETVVETSPAKKKGRSSVARVEAPVKVTKPSKQSKSIRHGRSSNTEAVRAVAGSADQDGIPKKRGRLSGSEKQVGTVFEEPDEDPIAPQIRRRRTQRVEADHHEDELDDSGPRREKKKKRLSGVEILEGEALALTISEDYAKGKPRTKPGTLVASRDDEERESKWTWQSDPHVQDSRPIASSTAEQQERGRAPTRQSVVELWEETMAGSSKQSKRGRQRGQRVEVDAASSKLQRNRSGPKKGVKSVLEKRTKSARGSAAVELSQKPKKRKRSSIEEAIESVVPELPKTHKKVSKRQAQEETQSLKRKDVEKHPESEPVKRRRVEKPPQQDRHFPEAEEAPMYQHLQAVTHKVSRQIIEAKWEPLPSGCIERISQFLQDLQRPVVVRYNDERKKTQSSTALQTISRRLVSKISKGLPFPQGTRNHREDDFDFEKILDHNRALEAQLTPALHANELLEAQVSKELALLESERETLATLEANAKTEANLRSEAARRVHLLLQPQDRIMGIEGLKDDVGLSNAQIPPPLDFSIQEDEHLQALVKDLHGHVDSIQGNIRQVQGVSQAVSKSKAVVQATLFDRLDSVQYDEVVLGTE